MRVLKDCSLFGVKQFLCFILHQRNWCKSKYKSEGKMLKSSSVPNLSGKIFFIILFVIVSFCSLLNSLIINIPADQPTIQAGINESANGDTVLVQPGSYVENINFNGHNITLASLFLTTQDTSYISQTIIDGDQNGSVVTFESGEDSTAVLCGFTIRNGYADYGGGIECFVSSPVLANLVVTNNTSFGNGGGVFCNASETMIDESIIKENDVLNYGAGIYVIDSYIEIKNSTISENFSSLDGGGIYCNYSDIIALNTELVSNIA